MAGSISATLEGFVSPASKALFAEHTYVASSCGFVWECFGNAHGGTSITAGVGNSFTAECLSYQRGNNLYADLRYAITGVCHQAANRILYPAVVTVWKAKGYGKSRLVYGSHGRGPWTRKAKCVSSDSLHSLDKAIKVQETDATPYGPTRSNNPMDDYDGMAVAMAGSPEGSVDEMRAFFEARLARPLPDKLIDDLLKIQSDLQEKQVDLVILLDSGEISREIYFHEFNWILRQSLLRSLELLGERDFAIVYGENGLSPDGLINPEIFFAYDHSA